ncbi:hypothetical protein [Nocardioides astragali]|uniref:Uncharacterized protein n=1 Tax=Nocardioides astragali TaxID=1776736 RepID=A0ABW2N680_9ACTN|nr:hypothetical protein [Nocardioides astragali]
MKKIMQILAPVLALVFLAPTATHSAPDSTRYGTAGLVATSAYASDEAPPPAIVQSREVPTVKVGLSVTGRAAWVIGTQPEGRCADITFTPGQTVRVRDGKTGRKVAVGTMGSCHYQMTQEGFCIAGLGCFPAIVRAVFRMQLPRLPYVGIPKYVINVGGKQFQIGVRKLAAEGWSYRF